MRLWRREWLRVGPVIAIAGGLLWLLAEGNIGQAALLRSTVWAVVVWVACGLVWMGLHVCEWDDQGPRQRDSNDRGPERRAGIFSALVAPGTGGPETRLARAPLRPGAV